jgi:hypothetical protein
MGKSEVLEAAPLFVSGLGWNILDTICCFWIGRLVLSHRLLLPLAETAVQGAQGTNRGLRV